MNAQYKLNSLVESGEITLNQKSDPLEIAIVSFLPNLLLFNSVVTLEDYINDGASRLEDIIQDTLQLQIGISNNLINISEWWLGILTSMMIRGSGGIILPNQSNLMKAYLEYQNFVHDSSEQHENPQTEIRKLREKAMKGDLTEQDIERLLEILEYIEEHSESKKEDE